MFVALDNENGQAFGPFDTREAAVKWCVEVLYAAGKWEVGFPLVPHQIEQDVQDLMETGWSILEVQAPPAPSKFKS